MVSGILSSISDLKSTSEDRSQQSVQDLPPRIPKKIITCNTRAASAKRVQHELGSLASDLTMYQNENVKGVKEADVILLACKPYNLAAVLGQDGIQKALAGKLLISILAGVTVDQILSTIYGSGSDKPSAIPNDQCRVVRVMPNTAALVRQSMTVIATPDPPLPPHWQQLVEWMFSQVGRVVTLPPSQMDACTALCGSGPATCAMVMEALADGALAMGVPRAEAQVMAAQTMRGAADLVLSGEHPALLREKVSTPGGCTIGGLLVLEEAGLRGTVARSVREATVVASQLGKGVQGVNGTRFR